MTLAGDTTIGRAEVVGVGKFAGFGEVDADGIYVGNESVVRVNGRFAGALTPFRLQSAGPCQGPGLKAIVSVGETTMEP